MKIAILSTIGNYEWAGTEEVWASFAKEALRQGHEVMLAADYKIAGSERVAELVQSGMKVAQRKLFKPMRLYLLKEKLMSDMKELVAFKPDILLINSGSLYDVTNQPYLYNLCLKLTIPKVFFCHFVAETLRDENVAYVHSFFKKMDSVVFVSEHNLHLAERQLASRLSDSLVIMNGPKLFLNAPLEWPDETILHFACVARFETGWKGHDVLLEVLSKEKWKNRNWHLNLYGKGPDESYIKLLVKLYQLENNVSFHGHVKNISEVWRKNHIKVLASRGEGTPLAVLEAMMCGRPTITTDAGGNREILEQEKTGWIADAATVYSFGNMLDVAWENRNAWQEMGKTAHQYAKKLAGDNPSLKLLAHIEKVVKN